MSHMEKALLSITDLDTLARAVAELGGKLHLGVKTQAWYGHSVGDYALPKGFTAAMLGHPEHVIRFPGVRYEAGVYKDPENPGAFVLLFDFFGYDGSGGHDGHKLAQLLGGNRAEKLTHLYGVHKALKQCQAAGLQTKRVSVGGKTKILVSGGRL